MFHRSELGYRQGNWWRWCGKKEAEQEGGSYGANRAVTFTLDIGMGEMKT